MKQRYAFKMIAHCMTQILISVLLPVLAISLAPPDPVIDGSNEKERNLMAAIRDGRADMVKSLLADGVDPNFTNSRGWTPLRVALDLAYKKEHEFLFTQLWLNNATFSIGEVGHIQPLEALDEQLGTIVRQLLYHGADPHTPNTWLLMWASIHGDIELVKILLKKGANVNSRGISSSDSSSATISSESKATQSCSTPLVWAAVGGHDDVVKLLRQHGAVMTLHSASMIGDKKEVQRLLNSSTDVNALNEWGWTPLIAAAWGGKCETIGFLLEKGAHVNLKAIHGITPLIMAARRNKLEAAKLLLDKGADINLADESGWTPLINAAWAGNPAVAKMLIDKNASLDAKDCLGRTAFIRAVETGRSDVVKLFLDKGANPNAREEDGRTPIMIAMIREDADMMRLFCQYGARLTLNNLVVEGDEARVQRLIDNGADLNAGDEFGRTALIWSAIAVQPEMVRLLLSKGAKVNVRDSDGATPLIWAAKRRQTNILKLLLDKGAGVDTAAKNGWTALMWACLNGDEDGVRLLTDRGADVKRTNWEGDTALRMAYKKPRIEALLKSHGAKEVVPDVTILGRRGRDCHEEWEFVPLWVKVGAPAPTAPHHAIRMVAQETTVRLQANSFMVDAIFHFFNPGKTTREWIGFPIRGNTCRFGRMLDPAFVVFHTWVDGQEVDFADGRGIISWIRNFFWGAPTPTPLTGGRRVSYDRFLAREVTFNGGTRTTIRLCYEDVGRSGGFMTGTAAYWEGPISNFTFVVDASSVGGTKRLKATVAKGLREISRDFVRFERTSYKPEPRDEIGVNFTD